MSRLTPPSRYIARPTSVVIRTVGDDHVAWNRVDGSTHLLSKTFANLLAAIPSRWTPEHGLEQKDPGAIEQLLKAGLLVMRAERSDERPGTD